MSVLSTLLIAFGISAILYVTLRERDARRRGGLPYPPGPSTWGVLSLWRKLRRAPANAPSQPWKFVTDLIQKYGDDFVHISIFGKHLLFLNSYSVANELLDKKAGIYSSRPIQTMQKLNTWREAVGFTPYGPEWREKRKLIHQAINKTAMHDFTNQISLATQTALRNLLKDSDAFDSHLRLAIGSNIMKVGYGIHVEDPNDAFLAANEKSIRTLGAAPFGRYLVDFFPIMQYLPDGFPLTKFKTVAKEIREIRSAMVDPPFERVKADIASGRTVEHSMASMLLSTGEHDENHVRLACGSLYNAGTDTTLIGTRAIILAMMHYPDVQAKVHAELDKVLGSGNGGSPSRLPEPSDRDNLPYLDAVIKEGLRWHSIAPFGVQHCLVQDDVARGCFIPKDTIIIANSWAMSRDERYYDKPDEFRPERHLGPSPQLDPHKYAFGFGRRICVGQHFADAVMFIMCASILACFEIRPPLGDDGKEALIPYNELHAGFLEEFSCRFVPRSSQATEFIHSL